MSIQLWASILSLLFFFAWSLFVAASGVIKIYFEEKENFRKRMGDQVDEMLSKDLTH